MKVAIIVALFLVPASALRANAALDLAEKKVNALAAKLQEDPDEEQNEEKKENEEKHEEQSPVTQAPNFVAWFPQLGGTPPPEMNLLANFNMKTLGEQYQKFTKVLAELPMKLQAMMGQIMEKVGNFMREAPPKVSNAVKNFQEKKKSETKEKIMSTVGDLLDIVNSLEDD